MASQRFSLSEVSVAGNVSSPETPADQEAIREQLDRLLASPFFRNSKRLSNLLRYVVENTIDGKCASLKERTVGVDVFGRSADYDTGSDHVVRSAAGEIRKRLAQYYMDPGHETEIRIDMPSGSYVPQFRLSSSTPSIELQPMALEDIAPKRPLAKPLYGWLVSILLVASIAVITVVAMWMLPSRSHATLDSFWRPVFSSRNSILLCIGNWDRPASSARQATAGADSDSTGVEEPLSVAAFNRQESQKVFLADAITLSKLVGLLQEKSKQYQVMSHSITTFRDLQDSPAVLIGLKSNYWTSRLLRDARFAVERGPAPGTTIIRDRRNPSRNDWIVNVSTPYMEFTRDYALVLRVMDPKTEQMVVTAAGITTFGTLAAGEFLTDPAQIRKLERYAPEGWENKNLEVVLSTDVIRGSPGPPMVVAADFW